MFSVVTLPGRKKQYSLNLDDQLSKYENKHHHNMFSTVRSNAQSPAYSSRRAFDPEGRGIFRQALPMDGGSARFGA